MEVDNITENGSKENTKLTPKEERFCYQYVLHLNAAKAATSAGYAEQSARITGCRLLTKTNIQKRIKYLKENLAETAGISSLRVIKEHEKIAFSSIAHLHNTWLERTEFERLTDDQKACIKNISTKIVKRNMGTNDEPDIVDVEYVKIELYDKLKSIDIINDMLGYAAPVKSELTGKDGKDLFAEKSIEEKKAELEVLLKHING
jgi:phage terminase small subunit